LLLAAFLFALDQPFSQRLGDGFGFRVDVKFGVDVFQVEETVLALMQHGLRSGLVVLAVNRPR
jgi:hypothetical protein